MSESNTIPIIFIHYGDPKFLKQTLALAKQNNPSKEVILLGDASNATTAAKAGARHVDLEDYHYGSEIEQFLKAYSYLAGKDHLEGRGFHKDRGADYWTRFNFLKWFRLNNFMKKERIERVWLFDSDVLILEDLSSYEDEFSSMDNTEVAERLINGMINNTRLLDLYTSKMTEVFSRPEYLDKIRKDLEEHPDYVLTMMHIYEVLKKEADIKYKRISHDLGGYTFDNALAIPNEFEYKQLSSGMKVKRIWKKNGEIYTRLKEGEQEVRMTCLNMSWLDPRSYDIIVDALDYQGIESVEIDLEPSESLFQKILRKLSS